MAVKLKSPIKREIHVPGIDYPIIAKFDDVGIEMSAPGAKIKVLTTWTRIAEDMITPSNVPSFLAGKPIEFLQYQAARMAHKKKL